MDSEEAARKSAEKKHTQFMVFGKKYRYIEVFQCSGDDMNLVLNGGLQPPVTPSKAPLLSPGMLPQAQATPQTVTQIPPTVAVSHPSTHFPTAPHPQFVTTSPHPASAAAAAAAAAQFSHHPPHGPATATAVAHPHSLPIQPPSTANATAAVAAGPLTLSIPPPSPAYLAQQQAQFIAQQNLLARQSAAAAVAQAQNDQLMFQNFGLLPSPGTTSQLALAHHPTSAAPPQSPQYVFMPRPYLTHVPLGFLPAHVPPFSLAPPPGATAAVTHHLQPAVSGTIKRSYESAFQQDPGTVAAPKRQLTRPPASFYNPFYPPGV